MGVSGRVVKTNYFRRRLNGELDELASKYIGSYVEDKRLIDIDIRVDEAHTLMLYKQGEIKRHETKKILEALEIAREDRKKGKFEFKPEDIDIHIATERYVIKYAGLDTGGKLHTGKSRNDQVVTDVRIYTREQIINILELLLDFISSLAELSDEYKEDLMPGYTHGQHAQVTTIGYYLLGYTYGFLRDIDRLLNAYKTVNLSPLGACALAGTSIKIDRKYTAKLLGFDGIIENSMDAVSSRDFIVETLSALVLIMTKLSRMAEDLIDFSTYEYGFVVLPDKYCDISSVMPQKKNPDVLEMIRANAGKTNSLLAEVIMSTLRLPTGYFKDLQPTKKSLCEAIDIVKPSIVLMKGIIENLEYDVDRMKEVIEENYVTAPDLAEFMVQNKNLSFRESHMLVGELVKRAEQQKMNLKELSPKEIREISMNILGKDIRISKKELQDATNPLLSVERRGFAGPSPMAIKRSLKSLEPQIKKRRDNIKKIKNRLKSAEERFQKTKDDILS